MLRLIAGALLAVGCSYIGVAIKHVYKVRRQFYSDFLQFLGFAKNEIAYLKTPLTDIIAKFTSNRQGLIVKVLKDYVGLLERGRREGAGYIQSFYLKPSDLKPIASFLEAFGKSGKAEELALIAATEEAVKKIYNQAADEEKQLGGMYFKLMVTGGVVLMLIVV